MSRSQISKQKKVDADIVVIGGGGTGLAAALTAAEKGARAVLLEKKGAPGGNTAMAYGLLAAGSPAQKRMTIDLTADDVFKQAMNDFHWEVNPRIWRAFLDKSGDTIRWLEDMGLEFTEVPYFYLGQTIRTWHCLGTNKSAGVPVVRTLRKKCIELGVQILTNSPAKKILTDGKGRVSGGAAETKEGDTLRISAKSVIIGTGGYGGNKELLKKYHPSYSEEMRYFGFPFVTGDGLLMAMEIGAATDGLGSLMLCWHCPTVTDHIDAAAQQPTAIFVNKKGERFYDETFTFRCDECGNALNRQPGKVAYSLFDDKILHRIMEKDGILTIGLLRESGTVLGTKLPNLVEELQTEASKGEAVKIATSWDEIAQWMGIVPKALNNTIEEYNSFCDQGYDPIFNKEKRYLKAMRTPPFYAIKRHLSFLTTIGGLKINHHMEVLNKEDDPIPGLYAGGDTVGGWEAGTYNKGISGSAFGFAVNSGRIAGENATKYALGK